MSHKSGIRTPIIQVRTADVTAQITTVEVHTVAAVTGTRMMIDATTTAIIAVTIVDISVLMHVVALHLLVWGPGIRTRRTTMTTMQPHIQIVKVVWDILADAADTEW